jgi:hypothetical protein
MSFYLATLALLPWTWFPPFPWIHEHAQWGDVTFAITVALWIIGLWKTKRWPTIGAAHITIALYFAAATLSFLFASPNIRGALKLLGIGELCLLAIVTSDLARQAGARRLIVRVVAASALSVVVASIIGLMLFYAGVMTPLVGIYGELVSSNLYARVQAGLYNPNLLASFCIFAASVVRHGKEDLSPLIRRLALGGLWIASLLTFSRGILGFLLAAVIARAHTRRRRLLAASFGALCIAAMSLLTFYKVSLDPTRPWRFQVESASDSSRYQALVTSAATLASAPLSGAGPGTHPARHNDSPFDSHMTALNIASTLGLPALIAFTATFTILWRKRGRPTSPAIWGGLAGLAIDALAQDAEDFRHVWVLMGIAIADSSKGQTESRKVSASLSSARSSR